MMGHAFETVDVFTDRRFGGNPLAVFTDARGLSDAEMQSLAFEFNLSETSFILPPQDPANTARVRIFHRTAEMPFAGHPIIGTAYVIARAGQHGDKLRLEVPAGIVDVDIERDGSAVVGGRITAPQPLSLGATFSARTIAACVGANADDVIVQAHQPIIASVGVTFVFAEMKPEVLPRLAPDLSGFRAAVEGHSALAERFSLFVYARDGNDVRARMFAPLAGTYEDPATGSAAATLAALLLHVRGGAAIAFSIRQGEAVNRPSILSVTAHRDPDGIRATVAGRCVPVLRGETQ